MAQLPQLTISATLGDQAYAAIREAIVSGVLQRGQKVTERGLAESLDISATPVREALRLEQDRP
jgi:DNA-binding GntR family transcriptional regulator